MRKDHALLCYQRGIVRLFVFLLLLGMPLASCSGADFSVAEPLTRFDGGDPDSNIDPDGTPQRESGDDGTSFETGVDSANDGRDSSDSFREDSGSASEDGGYDSTSSEEVGETIAEDTADTKKCLSPSGGGGTCISAGTCDESIPCCHGCNYSTCHCYP